MSVGSDSLGFVAGKRVSALSEAAWRAVGRATQAATGGVKPMRAQSSKSSVLRVFDSWSNGVTLLVLGSVPCGVAWLMAITR